MTRPWAHPATRAREAERQRLLGLARQLAERLDPALGIRAVVVFGSVARGDFNLWSDVDVLVVADRLPERWLDRLGELVDSAPARVSAVAWTPAELGDMLRRRNPIAVEARTAGVTVAGRPLQELVDPD